MKQVKYRNSASRILFLGTVFLVTFFSPVFAQDEVATTEEAAATEEVAAGGDIAKGEALFKSLCASCHKRYKRATGPALFGVTDRHSTEWLYSWIKNSAAMIASGDAAAIAIYEEYNKTAMNAFPQLSNNDIDDILAYVMVPKAEVAVSGGTTVDNGAGTSGGSGVSSNLVLAALALVFLMLVVVLFLVNKTLRSFAAANGVVIPEAEKRTPIWKAFVQNQFLVLVTAIFLLLSSAYFVYGFVMQVGIDQGYQPIQPIHYSHKIHAGDNQIECKYCHSSARVSKHSGIPSLNVCMNCHKSIGEVAEATATEEYSKEFYDGEIQKLYKAVGWDESTQSYTGKTEPVKWVRIHNLPDFAYFNHSQHVSVAGIECQKCHGPVEEMEIMYQHAPLTMGWCINCHRETNVKVEGNEYYEKIHEELSKKYGVDKLTAAQMGGLECGKCHY
ncbi:c-type cytochrome [Aquimarina addita]|uniref:C-type cytochrome n=1 Tax=Aquimarina addita TaxID=870485 RepID=A0ABP6UMJ8_9FLAO